MILKKPYGFIIKHFKIINFLLLIPTFYITMCISDIANFLKRFVDNKYTTFETGIAGKYITLWLLISLVFLILFNLLLLGLMKKKKKTGKVYVFSIIFYFIIFMLSLMLYNQFTSIELGRINTTIIGIYKDIMGFTPYAGYFLIVSTLFRAVGFNIKTLKFDQTIDIQLTEEDTEEFEIAGKEDQADLKKIAIHIIRELRYYAVENKFIVTCIVVLLLLVITSNVYINIGFYNKKYATNENFVLNNMLLSVKESYITNVDQGGNQIADNKYFLVVKLGIDNTGWQPQAIRLKDFLIQVNKKNLYPALDQGNKFLDIAKNYDGNPIPQKIIDAFDKPTYSCEKGYYLKNGKCSNKKENIDPVIENHFYCPEGYELKGTKCEIPSTNNEYVIAYELEKDQIQNSYVMKILNKTTNDIGELNPSYKMIKFKPTNLLNKEDMGTFELGDEINLKETTLGEATFKINKVSFVPSYIYEYQYCHTEKQCEIKQDVVTAKAGKLLVVVDDEIKYDKNSSFYKNTKQEFYKYFGKTSYLYENNEFVNKLKDVTPTRMKNGRVYEVSSTINFATNKKIIITIRNKYFTVNLE